MKRILAAAAVAGLALFGGAAIPAHADPAANQICPGFDSGKIDVSGEETSITIEAPEGQLITAVCVKAGSANQGLGYEITYFDPGVESVTLQHSSLKGISHYSVQYGDVTYPS